MLKINVLDFLQQLYVMVLLRNGINCCVARPLKIDTQKIRNENEKERRKERNDDLRPKRQQFRLSSFNSLREENSRRAQRTNSLTKLSNSLTYRSLRPDDFSSEKRSSTYAEMMTFYIFNAYLTNNTILLNYFFDFCQLKCNNQIVRRLLSHSLLNNSR